MQRCDELYVWPRGDAAADLRAILAVDHPAVLSLLLRVNTPLHACGEKRRRRVRKTRENPISLLDEAASVTLCRIHCALLG